MTQNHTDMKNKIHLLPDSGFVCFVIPALFSESECDNFLSEDIRNSFQKAITNYPTYYRNNDRLVIDSQEIANSLFAKVEEYLPQTIQIDSGFWHLRGINSRFRFCRYSAGQYFHRHLDGVYHHSKTVQSKLTFMLYLNSATFFDGGRTLFFKNKDAQDIWASYLPQQGDLIVFDHNIWHEGEELKRGEKYILRSDILYSIEEKIENTSIKPYEGHLGYIWSLLNFDTNFIISAGRDKLIKIWNQEGSCEQSLAGHENSILCLEKISDTCFLSGSRDRAIIVWEKKDDNKFVQTKHFQIHSAIVLSLCRINDDIFASCGGDNLIKVSNLNGDNLKTLIGHTDWVWQVIKVDNETLISCSEDKTIKIWNWSNEQCLTTLEDNYPLNTIAYQTSGRILAGGNLNGDISIIRVNDNLELVNPIRITKAHLGIVRTIIFINSNYLISGGEDNKIKIWDIERQICIKEFEHDNFVQSVLLNDENQIISASYDGQIKIWNLPDKVLEK